GNLTKITDFARKAREGGAAMAIFPEMAICGYPPKDLLLKDSFVKANLAALDQLAREQLELALLVGCVDVNPGKGRPLFNACAYIAEGQIKAKQYKTLLPNYDVFDEDRYFEPASETANCLVQGHSFGLSICEDIWNSGQGEISERYREDPVTHLAKAKPSAIINISASPFTIGKGKLREELLHYHASRHGVPIIFVNQVGGNDELIFDGRSFVVDAKGKVRARAKSFAEDLLFIELNNESKEVAGNLADPLEQPVAETYAALVLGTRDYLNKCAFKKAVIGLSGGIDSAVTCAIACEAMGSENVIGIAMPSPYSSTGSIEDARALAKNLGVQFEIISIEPAMQAFHSMLSGQFKGLKEDVTEENLQARLRGNIMMSLSNKFNYLVLTTGNKSELAVGYCTLYGDMCGGLAVISDVPKMVIYDLAAFINNKAGTKLIPQAIIDKAPSAELRPNQTDQDTLPPYPVLDAIINAYVEQRLKPDEIVKLGFDLKVVREVIDRVDRNEYKRKQAAPGLKVTSRAFGVGWRMPIAQGFRENLDNEKTAQSKVLC
ncbi:MAG: NAD+ synthase, partial [Candidatus Melainabacteria bacterium]